MTKLLTPLARVLLRVGVAPDAVTVGGTVIVVVTALWAFPTGHLFLGVMVITFTIFSDVLDGIMARLSGRSSHWGAFLDSTLDRFADAAIFAGLVLWFAGRGDDRLGMGLALACLVLGSVVPYTRARAEGVGLTANVGVAERGDRLLVTLVATGFVGIGVHVALLTVALGLLAVASAVTIGQRMATVYQQVKAAPSEQPAPEQPTSEEQPSELEAPGPSAPGQPTRSSDG